MQQLKPTQVGAVLVPLPTAPTNSKQRSLVLHMPSHPAVGIGVRERCSKTSQPMVGYAMRRHRQRCSLMFFCPASQCLESLRVRADGQQQKASTTLAKPSSRWHHYVGACFNFRQIHGWPCAGMVDWLGV